MALPSFGCEPVDADARRVIVGLRDRRLVLAEMLATARLDQPIDGVVGIVGAGLDALVAEIDRLLRVILDMRDVARRVVSVREVLYPVGIRKSAAFRCVLRLVRRNVSAS